MEEEMLANIKRREEVRRIAACQLRCIHSRMLDTALCWLKAIHGVSIAVAKRGCSDGLCHHSSDWGVFESFQVSMFVHDTQSHVSVSA